MEFEDVLTTERQAIGTEEVAKAQQLLEKYKAGKAALDQRIIENDSGSGCSTGAATRTT